MHKCAMTQLLPRLESHRVIEQRAFHTCAENELSALYNRHLRVTPTVSPDAAEQAFSVNYRWCKQYKGDQIAWTASQVLATRTGALLRRYKQAYDSLEITPVSENDSRVRMFVKLEKSNRMDYGKAPRAIQYRSTRYTAQLARFLIPIDKLVFRKTAKSPFVKGMTSFERAKRIRAMDRWGDTVYLGLDHSKFDSHVSTSWLRAEHRFYSWLNPDPELKQLLSSQCYNKCMSSSGIKYTSDGGRMSGEFNTSLGNNLINNAILGTVCSKLGVYQVDYDYILDGDDSIVALSRSRLSELGDVAEQCKILGMTTKVEEVSDDIQTVSFCQAKVVAVGDDTWRLVRAPERVLSRSLYTVRKLVPSTVERYIAAVADCELNCNDGVPVLYEFAKYLKRHSKGAAVLEDRELSYKTKLETHGFTLPITERARTSFAIAFDILPAEQLQLEAYYRSAVDVAWVEQLKAELKNGECYKLPPFFNTE